MSVLHVAEAFGGGLFEITRTLAEGLAADGHRVAIAYGVRPETPADPRAVIDERVALIRMPWTSRAIGAQVRGFRALPALVERFEPDVVHLHSSFAGIQGAAALAGGPPTVYTPQGYSFTMRSESAATRAVYLALELFVSRRVTLIGACSLTEGRQARRFLRAPRVAVIENGITELNDPLPPRRRTGGEVVAMGRPSPQRRPDACARILAAISDLAPVRWIGGGPESDGTRALDRAGIPVTGWLPREQTMRLLTQAKVYLHWTAWDGLPLSVLEAMAKDVVVVASDIAPNAEILGAEQVCTTEDQAIALIRAILADPDLHQRLLESQRRRRARYSERQLVERCSTVYRALVAGAAPSPAV